MHPDPDSKDYCSWQCCGSLTFWYGSGSADPYHLLMNQAPNPALFVSGFQDANRKYVFFLPGSASGSVSQRNGSEDPDPHLDPYQNVTIRNTGSWCRNSSADITKSLRGDGSGLAFDAHNPWIDPLR
jgi:hypothetical protein